MQTHSLFVPSRFTIRLKLLVITSAILILSSGSIIVLATHFFRKDNEIRVKENTMQLTEIIAKNINSEIHSVKLAVSTTIFSMRATKEVDRLFRSLLTEEPSILFLMSVTKSGKESFDLINPVSFSKNLNESRFRKSIKSEMNEFQSSFNGSIALVNLSPGLNRPSLGISFPYPFSLEPEILIVVLAAEAEKKSSKPELPSNSIVIYPKDTVVDLSGASSLSFEWSKWKVGREEYILSLYMDEKSTRRPVFQVKTRGTNYSYKNLKNLEEGKFSWEIAVHSGGRIVHRETSHFLITIGNLRSLSPEDIEFITPSVLYRTSGRTSGQAKD